MTALVLSLLMATQCGPGGCAPRGGGLPQMPYFVPMPPPVYVQPPIVSAPLIDGLTPAQIEAAKSDWDIYPTFHYGPGTTMVWVNGQLVPSQGPTHVSYPGGKPEPYVQGKAYPPLKSAPKAPALNPPLANQVKNCPNPNCQCVPPCPCADCKCNDGPQVVGQKPNFGIDEAKMAARAGRNRYSTNNGVEITKTETNRLFSGGELPNDSTYDMLAVIGSKEDCEKVRKDVDSDPAFAPLRDKLLVQCYQPDDEMVKRKGFAPGSPAIYLQDSNGKTKWREVEYRGPKVLAGEIDKRRPDYDPNKDPGPHSNPVLPSMPNIDLNAIVKHPLFLIVAAIFGLSILQRKPV